MNTLRIDHGRSLVELFGALYALGLGVVIWHTVTKGGAPFPGTGLSNNGKHIMALVLLLAAVIHVSGLRLDDRWRWSSALRLVGMSIHAAVIGFIASTSVAETGGFTYGCITIVMIVGVVSAARDTAVEMRGGSWFRN